MTPTTAPNAPSRIRSGERGFTLVELMITVMIVSILAAVAVPQYQSYVLRTNRAAAQAKMQEIAHWLQRAMTANGRYPGNTQADLPAAMLPAATDPYSITYLTANTGANYTLTAVPRGAQANDVCGSMITNERGAKSLSNPSASVSECWTH